MYINSDRGIIKLNFPKQNQPNTPPLRREDKNLVTGYGKFVADVVLEKPLHLAFSRAFEASGKILNCDPSDALEMDGVVATFSGPDVCHLGTLSVNPVLGEIEQDAYPILANGQILAVGQPVAAVLAETASNALDACEVIFVDIGGSGEPETDFDKTHPTIEKNWRQGDPANAFEKAAHIIETEIRYQRLAPSPMENRAIAVGYHDAGDLVTVWLSTQTPHRARQELSKLLKIDKDKIRVIAPDVGGAFGLKASLYPEEVLAVWAAFELKRSVRWISTRNEDMLSASHGRGIVTKGSLAVSSEGKFLGLKAEIKAPLGAWLTNSAAIPAWNAARILPGPYDIAEFSISTAAYKTCSAPVGIYRGAGRPEAAMLIERLVAKAAQHLAIDPIDLRKQNLLNKAQLPLQRTTGITLDSGDYNVAIDLLNTDNIYQNAVNFRDKRRLDDVIAGVGLAFFVEPSGRGWESASVQLNPDGTIVASTGSSTQGQGRETAYAQIVAGIFGCKLSAVTVQHGDTDTCPEGIGALASRSTAIGGSAIAKAAHEVLTKSNGNQGVAVESSVIYENEGEAWGYGCYLAEVAIDLDTGSLNIDKITCVDDAGVIINPMLVEGQLWGGLAQGIGEALMEKLVYDGAGQLVTGSLMDYALPRASDMPPVEFLSMETPSPMNILGAKGVGEAGTIGAPAVILNAVLDALQPLGVADIDLPLTSANIWHSIQKQQ